MANKAISIAVLILCTAAISCNAAAPAAFTTFNVMSYGAKPGSKEESTQAFIKAWNAACNFPGKARLLIPPGTFLLSETIFQGPCKGNAPITILLQGTLQAVSDISSYSGKGWLSLDEVDGVILTGGGTIDAQGQTVWPYNDCKTNPDCMHLPASLYVTKTRNVKIKYLKFVNSMGFHMHVTRSNLVKIHSLTITAAENSPNTDGMHVSFSNTVSIARSTIKTGDDCVSIGQGTTNLTINKVTCGPGHGISVGSLGKLPNELDVQGLIVHNCTLIGTTNGIRIKTYPASGPSKATGFLFKDIIMQNVQNPIIIDQNYGSSSSKPSLVKISDVFYQNIRGTTNTPVAVSIKCSSQVPCQNVHLHDINLKRIGNQIASSACSNVKLGYTGLQFPPPC